MERRKKMESNNHTGDASLDGMPTELFESIAENLGAKDLKSLRLVSRIVSKKVLRVYSNSLSSDYSFFLFNEDSMVRALEIARHPAFGKSITKVSIFCDRFQDFASYDPLNEPWKSVVEQAVAREKAFQERNGALSFLTTLLCVLSQHNKATDFEITTTALTEPRSAWMDPLWTQMRHDFFRFSDGFNEAVPTIIEGMLLSNVKPRSFAVGRDVYGEVEAEAFNPSHCVKVFDELESIRLPQILDYSPDIADQYAHLHWLTHAPRLKHLRLFDKGGEVLSCILRTQFVMLETCTLQMDEQQQLWLTLEELRNFTRLNGDLRAFNLECVDIYDCGEHLDIDEDVTEPADEQDLERLQEFLGVAGKHESVCLFL